MRTQMFYRKCTHILKDEVNYCFTLKWDVFEFILRNKTI